ncbi:MAG TPA: hypothetical protein VEB40_15085, partial [Flavipsychrobacter sp.]|nr:hypothetical protein [Flavipsychrobacter sp.]
MQYRRGLLLVSMIVSSLVVQAQEYQGFTMKPGARVIKNDTVIRSAREERAPLLTKKEEETYTPRTGKYKSVPLAGHKSYFGDKNDYMMGYCLQYMEAHNQTLNVVRDRSQTQFPLIDNILRKNNIPKELKYLAVIESAL